MIVGLKSDTMTSLQTMAGMDCLNGGLNKLQECQIVKKYFFIPLIITFLVWLFLPVVKNVYWYRGANPLSVTYFTFTEDTYWHPQYSEKKFKSIKHGQTPEEVYNIMGRPLEIVDEINGAKVWHYTAGRGGGTLSSAGKSTHVRAVVFDKSMLVTGIGYNFYLD